MDEGTMVDRERQHHSSSPEEAYLLVLDGMVLTLDGEDRRFDPGGVAIRGNEIIGVGPSGQMKLAFTARRVIDATGCVVMPGLINGHTHAAMTLFRGLADDLPLMDWLQQHIFPAEQRLTEEWVYWGTLLACAEMILSGSTTFCDMYLFEHKVAEAARSSIRKGYINGSLPRPRTDRRCRSQGLTISYRPSSLRRPAFPM
jgi:5-methylthioadenosine/S-adenosylhomocysteine deaminase